MDKISSVSVLMTLTLLLLSTDVLKSFSKEDVISLEAFLLFPASAWISLALSFMWTVYALPSALAFSISLLPASSCFISPVIISTASEIASISLQSFAVSSDNSPALSAEDSTFFIILPDAPSSEIEWSSIRFIITCNLSKNILIPKIRRPISSSFFVSIRSSRLPSFFSSFSIISLSCFCVFCSGFTTETYVTIIVTITIASCKDEITPFLDNPAVIPSAMLPAVSRISCGTSVVVLDIPSQTSRNDWNWLVVLTLTVTVRIKITINGNMILNAMCFFITTIPPGFRFGGIFFFLLVKKGLALSC